MTTIDKVVLESADPAAAALFLKSLGVEDEVEVRQATSASTDFRGFILSLTCSQPANVDAVLDAAVRAGATVLKPATKSFWGYGGSVRDADGTVWKVAASSKKDTAPARAAYDDLVLLLGVTDVKASKQLYADRGLEVAKSFGGKYAEFSTGAVTLALYPRKAAAKEAGLPVQPVGRPGLAVISALDGFTDPDGYSWETR